MSQYQRLFLIADRDMRHTPGLQRAAALATASDAALHIAAFVEPFATLSLLDKSVQEKTRESYLQEHREWLKDEAELLRSTGIKVTTEAVWTNHALEEILQHAAEIQADLLIKDLQHEPALKRAFITPLDWHLLRESPIPVHLVSSSGNALPRRVVAAVDPLRAEAQESGLNHRIIETANGLAIQCDAELHLLHAYDPTLAYLTNAVAGSVSRGSDLVAEMRSKLQTGFNALADEYSVPSERRHFIIGAPISAIADFARLNQTDVLVMGTVQRKGLDKLIGSTTEHLLYQVPCSILAVKA
ncbi:universal stress protein [Pseudomonas sp.]|uniref:universal stress protein n=1 Tax=Pseudomonas sp. TaxID=306 RepID=UPI0026338EAA|nr:universal stress protein [Pseudomonas sp.]